MKKLVVLFLMLLSTWATTVLADNFRVGLVLDRGGKDDKSFNSAAFRGATQAKEKLSITLKEVEASDDQLFEPAMRAFAEKNFDLIIGVGVNQAEAVKKIAAAFPKVKFAVVDAKVSLPNVASLVFDEHIGSYLVGYVAGLKTKTGKVGFLGGVEIPLIRRFELAYKQGAQAANPKVEVLSNYVGVTGEAWNNSTRAKELALLQYKNGSDIIFTAAGASNNGAFDAAASTKNFAIGCDSNQNGQKPGTILTSMLKRVDTAVFEVIRDAKSGTFKSGEHHFGIQNEGIDWALDDNNRKLFTEADLKKISDVRAKLAKNQIAVKDYYKK